MKDTGGLDSDLPQLPDPGGAEVSDRVEQVNELVRHLWNALHGLNLIAPDDMRDEVSAARIVVRDLKREITAKMDSLMREYGARGVLQEKFSDVRDGRYVLPVKVSDQSKVEGRVAELSVSKQTVFIEPKEVEQLQTQLRRREAVGPQPAGGLEGTQGGERREAPNHLRTLATLILADNRNRSR